MWWIRLVWLASGSTRAGFHYQNAASAGFSGCVVQTAADRCECRSDIRSGKDVGWTAAAVCTLNARERVAFASPYVSDVFLNKRDTVARVHIGSFPPDRLSRTFPLTSAREGPRIHPSRYQTVYTTELLFTRKKLSMEQGGRGSGERFFLRRRFPLWVSNDTRRAVNVEQFFDNRVVPLFLPLFWLLAGETLSP